MGEDRASLSGRRGRPLRALKGVGLLALGWLAGRVPQAWGDAHGLATAWQAPKVAAVTVAPPVAKAESPPPTAEIPPMWWPWLAPILVIEAPNPPPAPVITAEIRPERMQSWSALSVDYALPVPANDGPRVSDPPASPEAYRLAAQGYGALAAGDRRDADALFAAALAAGPHPNAPAWAQERKRLRQRWSVDLYALLRDPGPVSAAQNPLLGGGQVGTNIGWKINPLASRPLSLVLRTTAANDDPRATGQAAVGVKWQVLPWVSVSAERLLALGEFATDGFTGRIAAGAEGRRGMLEWQTYGEAGIIDDGSWYGGGQARLTTPLFNLRKGRWSAGGGAWGGAQSGLEAATRLDVGPSLLVRQPVGRVNLSVEANYRWRVAGNADPGNGPAVTLATSF